MKKKIFFFYALDWKVTVLPSIDSGDQQLTNHHNSRRTQNRKNDTTTNTNKDNWTATFPRSSNKVVPNTDPTILLFDPFSILDNNHNNNNNNHVTQLPRQQSSIIIEDHTIDLEQQCPILDATTTSRRSDFLVQPFLTKTKKKELNQRNDKDDTNERLFPKRKVQFAADQGTVFSSFDGRGAGNIICHREDSSSCRRRDETREQPHDYKIHNSNNSLLHDEDVVVIDNPTNDDECEEEKYSGHRTSTQQAYLKRVTYIDEGEQLLASTKPTTTTITNQQQQDNDHQVIIKIPPRSSRSQESSMPPTSSHEEFEQEDNTVFRQQEENKTRRGEDDRTIGRTQSYWNQLLSRENDHRLSSEILGTNSTERMAVVIKDDRKLSGDDIDDNRLPRKEEKSFLVNTTLEHSIDLERNVVYQRKMEKHDTATTAVFVPSTETTDESRRQNNGPSRTLVALLSEFSGTLKQRNEQQIAMSILRGNKIHNIEEVDGSATGNTERRNLLFEISKQMRGTYPQFFLQHKKNDNNNIIVYLGDFDWVHSMNETGLLTNHTIFGGNSGSSTPLRRHESKAKAEEYKTKKSTEVFNNFYPTVINDHTCLESLPPLSSSPERTRESDMISEDENGHTTNTTISLNELIRIESPSCAAEKDRVISTLESDNNMDNTVASFRRSKYDIHSTYNYLSEIESQDDDNDIHPLPSTDEIEIIDVEALVFSKGFVGKHEHDTTCSTTLVEQQSNLSPTLIESSKIEYNELEERRDDVNKVPNNYVHPVTTDLYIDNGGDVCSVETDTIHETIPRVDNYREESQCITIKDSSVEDRLLRGSSNDETEVTTNTSSKPKRKKGRRTLLASVGSLLDTETDNNEELLRRIHDPSRSSPSINASSSSFIHNNSDIIPTVDLEFSHSPSISPTALYSSSYGNDREMDTSNDNNANVDNNYQMQSHSHHDLGHERNTLRVDIPTIGRTNEIDRCTSFEKLELPRVGRDTQNEQKSNESKEVLTQRRQRWKQKIVADHLNRNSTDSYQTSSSLEKRESPVGSSLNEIEMINIFLTIVGPDFDGSYLSPARTEEIYEEARMAGFGEEFINQMLDQSAGILRWERKNMSSGANGQPSPSEKSFGTINTMNVVTESPIGDEIYDKEGFTRNTPEPESKFACFKSAFWAESSTIVRLDMIENIQAALSGDNEESVVGEEGRSVDILENEKAINGGNESKIGWRSTNMIESIKATLSGDSESKRGWQSTDIIENIKNTFSGESECKRDSRLRVADVNETVQTMPTRGSNDVKSNEDDQSAILVETVQEENDSKIGWRSTKMIASIKATLTSGDSSESKRGWRSTDIMKNIKNTFSGENERNKDSQLVDDMNETVQIITPLPEGATISSAKKIANQLLVKAEF